MIPVRMALAIGFFGSCAIIVQAGDEDKKLPPTDPMHPYVKVETNRGDIVLRLDAEKAPISTENFVRYAEDKFYDGTIFHRVIKGFMIQGGGYTASLDLKTSGRRAPIRNEWRNGLKNKRGWVAMARLGGQHDSATSQFFINVVDNGRLDGPVDGAGYAVFGQVVQGLETVDVIQFTDVDTNPKLPVGPFAPVEAVEIKSVRLISEFDKEKAAELAANAQEVSAKAETVAKAAREAKLDETVAELEKKTGKTAEKTSSGLRYIDLVVGDGDTPQRTDTVEVHYTGWLDNGTKFDSSVDRGKPFTFRLSGGVIQGWL